MNDRGVMLVARKCTYHDFVKCQPLNFKGTEGVVGLIRWFKKMETIFHISNCPEKYEVNYAMCIVLKSALTWWNSHKRTIRADAAFAMSWRELMKLMTEFIGGLPDNISGNVITAEPTRLQDAIRITNNLMDQRLKGYAARSVKNKRRLDINQKDNLIVRKLGTWQGIVKPQLLQLLEEPQSRIRRLVLVMSVGGGDTIGVTAQNRRNKTNEARGKAYVLGGGDANPDSNVVLGMFLLNKPYASMLFDLGADRSFVSSTFSALLDVISSTLDVSYAIKLADGRIA
ncbi:hypothetical protein Tco_0528556 [Tanacetum coccineum]